MAIKTYTGPQNGDYLTASNWSTGTAPRPYDILVDNFYNININNVTINHEVIDLDQATYASRAQAEASLTLNNSTLGRDTLVISQHEVGIGLINLNDSYLRGTVLNLKGQTQIYVDYDHYGVNFGTLLSYATTPKYSDLGIIGNGSFDNAGVIRAIGINASAGVISGYGTGNQFQNTGLIEADAGASVGIGENVVNRGQIRADGGSVAFNANILQVKGGSITLTNNSTMTLQGASDGGVINIQSSMLNFSTAQFIPGHTAASDFNTAIHFMGQTDSLFFGMNISETFDAATNDLKVTIPSIDTPVFPLVSIHLQGSYAASDFSVQGQSVVYTAHHGVA